MKILMVNKFLHPNGGSETYVFNLGKYLSVNGHEVQYFGMEHEGRIVGNRVNAYTSDMDFHGGSLLSKLSYPLKTIYSFEARKKIRLILDDFQPDVVHINNFTYQLTPSIILEIIEWRDFYNKGCQIVFTAHDYNLICPNHMLYNPNNENICEKCLGGNFMNCFISRCIHGSLLKSLIGAIEGYFWNFKAVYKHIDAVICCSHFLKKKMDTNPIFKGKTVVLHNFIDSASHIDVKKKDYVLYFGRFSKEKGIKTLIAVCQQLPQVNFVFAGTGPLSDEINKISNINNVGFKTGTALENLIREARFSVYPSEWYENCPFSVMESQMYETPVIGADIGGVPELIDVGRTGELFASGDVDSLKNTIYNLWNNPKKLSTYSQNCRHIKFDDTNKYYKKIMKIYEGMSR